MLEEHGGGEGVVDGFVLRKTQTIGRAKSHGRFSAAALAGILAGYVALACIYGML